MKIIEINGQKVYQWEESDRNRQDAFEEAVGYAQSLEKIINALLTATSHKEKNAHEAWKSAKELICQLDPDVGVESFKYDWILGAFKKT